MKAYQDCLNNNFNKYNWLIFYDIDEFIYLRNFNNLKNYLNRRRFNKCQTIQLNEFHHTDNDLLFYDNRKLFERFKKTKKRENEYFKSILKGNIKTNVTCPHNINKLLLSCNGFGKFNKNEKINVATKFPDFKYYYIDHFYTKSTEEFLFKLQKGDVFYENKNKIKMFKIKYYFNINRITKKKLDFIAETTKLNLSFYYKILNGKYMDGI